MPHKPRAWFPVLSNPPQHPRRAGTAPGDWPLRTLDSIALPPQVMALLPDWLLLRLRRDESTVNSPVLAVEKLNSLPPPLGDADKEVLVGAVLTMSSSLHLALGMLREMLPQETSQDRLGEVLCPTLGSLLDSLQSTLCSFDRSGGSRQAAGSSSPTSPPSGSTPDPATPRVVINGAGKQQLPPRWDGRVTAAKKGEHASFTRPPSRPQSARAETERFPSLTQGDHSAGATGGHHLQIEVDIRRRPATHLVTALQAEMRVQAAIKVAVESLEFAEGQLQMVKEVNRLHGGSTHFYGGYNRLLSRALELQRRELEVQSGARESLISVASSSSSSNPAAGTIPLCERARDNDNNINTNTNNTPSLFKASRPSSLQPPLHEAAEILVMLRFKGDRWSEGIRYRASGRRATTDSGSSRTKPPLRRRMSLADELAMAGEDSESAYHDETSEMASSASELESDFESCNDPRVLSGRNDDSEEHSTYGESTGDESAFDSPDEDDHGDRTLNGLDADSSGLSTMRET
ncbi:hypothetical protein C7999DRAFT_17143 [Corynascus novoguineensis]|uniref:Uncharacterized protein n=1 Tax=Corynascus novoguineensis TaxID=1126955 RepID=A0AAN7CM60_9PEZI|nr:hypothetical protein C7999DRAFT_17143 [Corynascus novoguineensis]